MNNAAEPLATRAVRERVSPQEWEMRTNLAARYRLAAHFRMTDLIYTHMSARLPGPEHRFLINTFGQMWDEITASTPGKVTPDREIADDPSPLDINQAGFVIHSDVHKARMPDWRALRRMPDRIDPSYRQ
jgi:ribulose-5-phosphate 4-epimerase/fuculose-1-phosphate aldolase